jgi:hypothetical protein
MSFLAPAALFGVLLLGIPVLVHLFKPRKMRRTPFSSLRWLRQTQQRMSRRIQWHQILLFLLRAAFLLLLVLALAKPLVGTQQESRYTDRFIILDVSRSMAYKPGDRPSPLERARQIAEDLIAQAREGDRTALLFTGSTSQVITPPTIDPQAYLHALRTVEAGAGGTNLSSALEIIKPMLAHGRPDSDVELYFLTDNHQQSWRQAEIASFVKDLPVPVRVRLVDVGVAAPQNAWIAGARLATFTNPARRFIRVEVGCVGDQQQKRTVHLTGLAGVTEQTRSVTIDPGRPARVQFEIPASLSLTGQVARIRLEPADALPSDDQFFLNLDTAAGLRVLVVEDEGPADDAVWVGRPLCTAIEEAAAAGNEALTLEKKTTAAVTAADLAKADVIFLAGVTKLPDNRLRALEKRVESGAGLVLFLGSSVDPEFYNNKLYRPLRPSQGLLPLPLKSVDTPDSLRENPAPIRNLRWAHPLLAPLYDPVLCDLPQTRFRAFYRFGAKPTLADTVLAWIDDEEPAVVERSVGAGKVLFFNTTPNDDWSDLCRRTSFVPLVDRLLSYLSAGGVRRTFEVGEVVLLPLADWKAGETVTVRTPAGKTLTPEVLRSKGRTLLRLNEVSQPGVYRVERKGGGTKGFPFVVRVGPGDSVLTPMDGMTLKKWWRPVSFEVVSADAAGEELLPQGGRFVLWPWLVLLAGLLLLAEMYFVHRLCPRVNPATAGSVVHKRGLLRPVG